MIPRLLRHVSDLSFVALRLLLFVCCAHMYYPPSSSTLCRNLSGICVGICNTFCSHFGNLLQFVKINLTFAPEMYLLLRDAFGAIFYGAPTYYLTPFPIRPVSFQQSANRTHVNSLKSMCCFLADQMKYYPPHFILTEICPKEDCTGCISCGQCNKEVWLL